MIGGGSWGSIRTMARKRTSRGTKKTGGRSRAERSSDESGSLQFGRVNAVLGAAGLVSLVLGYVLLAQSSITAAPLLLVLGYVVLLPLALIL